MITHQQLLELFNVTMEDCPITPQQFKTIENMTDAELWDWIFDKETQTNDREID